jgi:hypothetical protein
MTTLEHLERQLVPAACSIPVSAGAPSAVAIAAAYSAPPPGVVAPPLSGASAALAPLSAVVPPPPGSAAPLPSSAASSWCLHALTGAPALYDTAALWLSAAGLSSTCKPASAANTAALLRHVAAPDGLLATASPSCQTQALALAPWLSAGMAATTSPRVNAAFALPNWLFLLDPFATTSLLPPLRSVHGLHLTLLLPSRRRLLFPGRAGVAEVTGGVTGGEGIVSMLVQPLLLLPV